MLESGFDLELTGPKFIRDRIPGDGRFGSSATGGRADTNDLRECHLAVRVGVEFTMHGESGAFDQARELNRGGALTVRAAHGSEFECAHAAFAHVGEAIQCGDAVFGNAALGHPGVDQVVAEIVRQGISEHRGQSFEGQFGQVREDERSA